MANGVSRRESRLERPRLYREESMFMRDRGLFFSAAVVCVGMRQEEEKTRIQNRREIFRENNLAECSNRYSSWEVTRI